MSLSLLQYNIFSLAVLLPVILNLFVWQRPAISLLFGGVFFLFQCFVLGPAIAPNRSFFRQTLWGGMATMVLLLICSTALYIAFDLSASAQATAWLLHILIVNIWLTATNGFSQTRLELHHWNVKHWTMSWPSLALGLAYAVLLLWGFVLLISAQTTAALRSPWEVLPPVFWGIAFVTTLLAWLISWYSRLREGALLVIMFQLFFLFSVALIVYGQGYGYDSFIHKTSEQIIDSMGILLPKTPYYLGQYGLVVSLHRLLGIAITTIDAFLLPLLAAISLPLFAAEIIPWSTRSSSPGLRQAGWLSLAFVLLPFSSFIVTTPQGLANLFFLWFIFGSFALLSDSPTAWRASHLFVIALSAMLTHPLTGIPILLASIGYVLIRAKDRWPLSAWIYRVLWWQWLIMSAVSIPLLLWLWSLMSQTVVLISSFDAGALTTLVKQSSMDLFASFMPAFPTQFAYGPMTWWASTLIVIALFVCSWLIARLHTVYIRLYLSLAGLLLVNAVLVATLFRFPGIAAYEATAYASRLLTLALWSLLPFLLLAMIWLCKKVTQSPLNLAAVVVILALTWGNTASLYASYPRHNRFERSRQYSTSAADFQAVRYINDQQKSDFVVLANQSVSAAAIAEYGFRTYFPTPSGDYPIFYYPVPTSSPLYGIYLRMVNEAPTRDIAALANNLTGAGTVYFVLNNYWDNAAILRARAQMEADSSADIADGAITVFTFHFTSPDNQL